MQRYVRPSKESEGRNQKAQYRYRIIIQTMNRPKLISNKSRFGLLFSMYALYINRCTELHPLKCDTYAR